MHHRHPVRHGEGDVHVVLDEDQRDLGVEPLQEIGEKGSLSSGETRGGLVQHHELRIARSSHTYLELTLLPVRERPDERADLASEPNLFR